MMMIFWWSESSAAIGFSAVPSHLGSAFAIAPRREDTTRCRARERVVATNPVVRGVEVSFGVVLSAWAVLNLFLSCLAAILAPCAPQNTPTSFIHAVPRPRKITRWISRITNPCFIHWLSGT